MQDTWFEQRNWAINFAVIALPPTHRVRQQIEAALPGLRPRAQGPDLTGYSIIDYTSGPTFKIGGYEIGFDTDSGVISHLIDTRTGVTWANNEHPLAQFIYQSFSEADFSLYLEQYMYIDWGNVNNSWAFYDFGKSKLEENAHPIRQTVRSSIRALYRSQVCLV
jgi:hypothetical protein